VVDRPADSAVAAVDGASANAQSAEHAKVTFGDVFAVREFRVLWLAQLLSVAGDQLARVAMTVLVYDRTHSALWSALTFAVTFLPWIVGGLGLSGLADRLPRRQVMITCDLARMVLVCLMALTSMLGLASAGLWVTVALLFLVTLLDAPYGGMQVSQGLWFIAAGAAAEAVSPAVVIAISGGIGAAAAAALAIGGARSSTTGDDR
jgi:MFS family permease